MGTVSDKLTYLNTTKGKIKDVINITGANITDDTFRSYPDKLKEAYVDIINNGTDELYSNFPKTTGEGVEIALNNTFEAPMRNALKGNTEQTTYSGKNLLSYTLDILKTINTQGTWNNNAYSYNGVDYTINEDLTIKTNGTASGASYLIINNDLNLTSGTDYKLNGCPTGGGVSTYAIRLYTGNNYVSQTGLDFPFTYESQNLVRINVFSGTNVDNLVFKPMVRLASITDDTYEPYTNGPSPNPDYPQDIKVVKGNNTINVHGKNLIDLSVIPASINRIETYNYNNNILTITGADTSLTGNRYARFDVSNYEIGKTYTISAENITNNSASDSYNIVAINSYNGSSNQALGYLRKNQLKTSFTIPSDIQQLRIYFYTIDDTTSTFTKIQLEQNSTATPYQPYTSTDYAVNIGSMELCKTGDYQDLILKSTGKNLLNVSNSYSVTTSQEVNINLETGTYVMSCDSITTNITSGSSSLCNFYHNDNTYDQLYFSHTNKVGQVTITAPVTKVKIYSSNSFNNSDGKTTTFTNLMIEKGSTATDYEPYGNVWYKKGYIGKVTLDGSESWTYASSSDGNRFVCSTYTDTKIPSSTTTVGGLLSNKFIAESADDTSLAKNGIAIAGSGKLVLYYDAIKSYTTGTFITWITNNNVIVYYVLATPTYTEITDTDLINQLEAFTKANSVDEKTFINQTNADLPFIISASALSKI